MWWMDLEPYPGPVHQKTIAEVVTDLTKSFQIVFHTTERFGKSVNQFFLSTEHSDPGPTPVWRMPARSPEPGLNKNGPRRGPAYDHRGRRRW